MPSLFLPLAKDASLALESDDLALPGTFLWHLTPKDRDRRKPHFSLPESRARRAARTRPIEIARQFYISLAETREAAKANLAASLPNARPTPATRRRAGAEAMLIGTPAEIHPVSLSLVERFVICGSRAALPFRPRFRDLRL
jgi:hypothetical protein